MAGKNGVIRAVEPLNIRIIQALQRYKLYDLQGGGYQ